MNNPRCFIFAAGVLILTSAAFAADWPQFLGPKRNGISDETGLVRQWPAQGPKVLWTVPTGPGYGGAAIDAGKVYFIDRVDDARDVLRCLDLQTGKEQWNFSYSAPGALPHNGSRTTPTVDEKFIFTVGPHGDFYCVDKQTHKEVWHKHLLKDYGTALPRWGVSQSPVLYKDMVIVAPQSQTVGVAAFDKATGKLVWQTPSVGDLDYCSPILANIGGVDQIVMISGSGASGPGRGGPRAPADTSARSGSGTQVNGFDARDGRKLWTYTAWQCRHPIPSPAIIGDGRIFMAGGYGGGCAMIRVAKNGDVFAVTELFRNNNCGPTTAALLVWKDHIYTNSNDNGAGLMCMDLDGNVKWKTGRSPWFDLGNVFIADGLLFAIDGAGGELRLAEATPGGYRQLASARLLEGKEIWAPMALSNGRLIVRDQSQAKCLDLRQTQR